MISWNNISLYVFQRIQEITEERTSDDLDKILLCTCEVYGITEFQLSEMKPARVNKMIGKVLRLLESDPDGIAISKMGPYAIMYDPAEMTLGQFIELKHFLQDHIRMGHYAMASISKYVGKCENDSHPLRADYFLRHPVPDILAALNVFSQRFSEFIGQYINLFGLDHELYDGGEEAEFFSQRYGWIFSAVNVADHERITLDEAYGLPIRQAFNDLMYLKAKNRFEAEQRKKIFNNANLK